MRKELANIALRPIEKPITQQAIFKTTTVTRITTAQGKNEPFSDILAFLEAGRIRFSFFTCKPRNNRTIYFYNNYTWMVTCTQRAWFLGKVLLNHLSQLSLPLICL